VPGQLSGIAMSDDQKKSFTVSDRRHFTAEGEARPEAPPEAVPTPAAAAAPDGEGVAEAREDDLDQEEGPPDFSTLLLSLGSQASMLLGLGAGGPEGDLAAPDLRGARDIISLLEVLSEKTRGNRTADEDRLLETLLYELRMAFVARSRTGA
jgi:hypothetical protein